MSRAESVVTAPNLLDGRLKLRHLLLVHALSEHGSVVSAAGALHVTQPVVTRGLQEVEQILGVHLFTRGPRGVTPTRFGEAFTRHARAVLAELSQAGRHMEELADGRRGLVTVGTHLAGSNLLLPRAIVELKASRPHLTVVVREGRPAALETELATGKLDLVIARLAPSRTGRVHSIPLYEERIRFATRAGHPLAAQDTVALEEVLAWPWIVPGTDTVLRTELEDHLARHRQVLPDDRIETTSFLTVRRLVLDTDSVAVVPELIVADDDRFALLPLGIDTAREVGVMYTDEDRSNPATRAMIHALRVAAGAMRAQLAPGAQ